MHGDKLVAFHAIPLCLNHDCIILYLDITMLVPKLPLVATHGIVGKNNPMTQQSFCPSATIIKEKSVKLLTGYLELLPRSNLTVSIMKICSMEFIYC